MSKDPRLQIQPIVFKLPEGVRRQLVNTEMTVVDDLVVNPIRDIAAQQETSLEAWFQDVADVDHVQPAPREELDDLIVEREWFDQEFPQRVAALVREHRRKHGKDPERVFLLGRFARWIHKRWGDYLDFEIPPEPYQISSPERVVIERVGLKIDTIVGSNNAETIRLDTFLESSELSIRCGYCNSEFALLMTERQTQTRCQRCGRMMLIEHRRSTGEVVIHPVTETDKP